MTRRTKGRELIAPRPFCISSRIGQPKMLDEDLRRNCAALKGLRVREPNGRLSRKARPKQEIVYIVRQEGSDRIKVGRTGDLAGRMQLYESASGVPVHYAVQMHVSSKDDGKKLERHLIRVFALRFSRFKREWFQCPFIEIFDAVTLALCESPVNIVAIRGNPSLGAPVFDQHRHDASSNAAAVYWKIRNQTFAK